MKFFNSVLVVGFVMSMSLAFADDVVFSSFEVGAGYEYENMSVQVPGNNDPDAPTNANDSSRSGARLVAKFGGIGINVFKEEPGKLKLRFVPIQFSTDVTNMKEDDAFGRIAALAGDGSAVRRVYGILVEGVYTPAKDGVLFVRGHLGSVEYDRDRGMWDWRILDTALGVKHAVKVSGGKHVISFEASGGASGGIVKLTDFARVQEALGVEKIMASTPTINPYISGMAAYEPASGSFRIELSTRGEKRLDLRGKESRGTYLGHEISADSERINTALTASLRLPVLNGKFDQCSVFARVEHEYDTLTMSQALLGTRDGFQAITGIGGMKCKF